MNLTPLIVVQLDENLKCKWRWNCPWCSTKEYVAKRSIAEKHLKKHLTEHAMNQGSLL